MHNKLNTLKQKIDFRFLKTMLFVALLSLTFLNRDRLPIEIHKNILQAEESSLTQNQAENTALSNPNINLTDIKTYAGLPVADVKYYSTENAKGTVLFFPQIHLEMGTNALSKTNDAAQLVQNQSYKIMDFLLDKTPLNLIMEEGELYGPINEQEEVKDVKEQETLLQNLHQQQQLIEQYQSAYSMKELPLKDYLTKTKQMITLLERKSIIEGAPFTLKAEGHNFYLIGTESPESYQQSAQIMQENIDLEDRLDQVLGYSNSNHNATSSRQSGQNDQNPFTNISDVKKLQNLLKESDKKIEATVMDQRNQDAAANVAKAFEEYHTDLGILQFGAAHEDGLVKELQKQGLNVVVITPNEVAK